MIKVTRKTTESIMQVTIMPSPVAEDYRKAIVTPLPFLSHMIEHIVWRSGLNISATVKTSDFYLTHVICEDLGITLGKALGEYLKREGNLFGYGNAIGIIDEARAFCGMSFESRAYFGIEGKDVPDQVEGMASEDLAAFLEGIAQGANMTLQINVEKGVNAHHIWEAVFRGVGRALCEAFKPVPGRENMTAGVAGAVEFIIE